MCVCVCVCVCARVRACVRACVTLPLQSLSLWVTLARSQSSVDEDVPGPASAPFLDLRPDLPHHAGPEAGLQDPVELVSHLPPRLDL